MIDKHSGTIIGTEGQTGFTSDDTHSSDMLNSENIDNMTDNAEINPDTNSIENTKKWFSFKELVSAFKQNIKQIKISDFIMCLIVSWVMVFALEALSRHSVSTAFTFMVKQLPFFASNFTIILCTMTICLFFKRRYFVMSLIILVWLSLGVANCVVLTFRNTPLAWVDLSIVKTALDIMNSYVKPIQFITGCVIAVVAILVIVLVLKFAPKKKPNFASAIVFQSFSALLCVIAMVSSYHIYKEPECFANLPEAYRNYGFAYCFSSSAVNRGVDKPADYSKESINNIVEKVSVDFDDSEFVSGVQPNIIYVQLESFFDVNYLKDVVYSQDPMPNYRQLKKNNPSGFLRIPGLGGGTCNAEFEVLTGMSVGMFGTCEYPYKTITLDHTAGSVCYELKNYGYSTHAVHNHTGTFYDRHRNYANLGFDTFVPVEFMHDVERNANNWAKDKILTGEIFKCLNSTEGRDFVFAVSVQSHGKYPTEVIDPNQTIFVKSGIEDEEYKNGFEYYINQLYEMDMFVGELISTLQNYREPTVLVLYGDHLPAMNIEKEKLENEDLFETEYVIWSNYDLPKMEDEYLYAYQLNSRVTELLGIKGSHINALHRYYKNDKENPRYLDELQALTYDELYGENYANGGKVHIERTEIKYGIDPVLIERASVGNTATTLKGTGFTEKSKVFVNDTLVSATYVDTNTLILPKTIAKPNDSIYVAQRCSDKHILYQTEPYSVKETDVLQ